MAPSPAGRHSHKQVLLYCSIICLAPVIFGFDYGGSTGFLAMPRFVKDFGAYDPKLQQYNISASNQTLLTGTPLALACVAAWISGPIGTYFGRRFGLAASAIASLVGPSVQAGATKWHQVVIGRCISGIGIGFAYNFSLAYWSESTPASLRGSVVVMYQGITNVAQFVAQCVNQGTHDIDNRWAYRIPLLLELIAPALLLVFLFWIPDTPRWYMSRGKVDKALTALRRFRGSTYSEDEIQSEHNEISAFIHIEQTLQRSTSYLDCFRGTDARRTILTVGMTIGQAWSGIAFISSYGTYFFSVSGVTNPFLITIATGLCGIAGSASSLFLVRHVGRKRILLVGAFVCGLSMLVFAIVALVAPNSPAAAKCLAAFVCLYIYAYGASWGPITGVVIGELPSTRLRSRTIAIGTSVGWLSDILIVCSIPYLISVDYADLGAKVGFIFGGLEIIICLGTYFFLPEMKDRTLEEIDEMFLNNVPAKQFSSYEPTGHVQGISVQAEIEKVEVRHMNA